MLNYLPKFFSNKAIALYFIALIMISLLFFNYSMSLLWIVLGIVEVVGFFFFSNLLTKRWQKLKEKTFTKRLFTTSVIIRVIWVVFSYFLYLSMTGQPFEFGAADALAYHAIAEDLANRGYSHMQSVFWGVGIGDMGYGTYLGTLYMFTGKSIFIARLMKALWGAWTVILIYKITKRNFGESTGRIAGIIAMLFPNLIYYCGLHLKEIEMVFLVTLFIERTDYLLKSKQFNFINVILPLLLAGILFTFRTVLGATALFALFSALLFTSSKVSNVGNRLLLFVWAFIAVLYFMGGRINKEVDKVWQERTTNQEASMISRANKEGGNLFAKYGTASLFAPAIFTIPVASMVDVEGQENQQLIHGGNFIKNVLAFFIYFFLFWMIRQRKWRDFVLLEVFFVGYLGVVALSAFAHSERFHQPILPLFVVFVAYAISNTTNKTKKYFNWYMIGLFVVLLVWNYIKLKGRGLG